MSEISYEGLPVLKAFFSCIEGLVGGCHNVTEGHQTMLDHPNKLDCHDQYECDHEECPDWLKLQVVHMDIHHVSCLPHISTPGDA